jgi:hypothetical protein
MKLRFILITIALAIICASCATSRDVLVGQLNPPSKISTAALIPQDGNSPEMDSYMQRQLTSYGIIVKPVLPAGTRQSKDVDLILAYTDVWSWDLVMYLDSLRINLFEGSSGNLLVTGTWKNSFIHSFPNAQVVIKELLDDMFAKMNKTK